MIYVIVWLCGGGYFNNNKKVFNPSLRSDSALYILCPAEEYFTYI